MHCTWKGWIVLMAAMVIGACARAPAEQRLRDAIAAMETAAEAGQAADFVEHVSQDFTGKGSDFAGMAGADELGRAQLYALLRAIALRHRDIGVVLGPLDIVMHGEDRATVKVDAVLTGGSGGLLPDAGQRLRIDSGWRDEDGDWRCISARWTD